jgi:KDO2-lipid IV(A) lauroyltransferase
MRSVLAAVSPWPRPVTLAVGAALGRAARDLLHLRRDVADENIRSAFPSLTARERAAIAWAMYAHFGRVAAYSLRLTAGGPREVLPHIRTVEGEAMLRAQAARGRGVIALTGHHGNWEVAGTWAAAIGLRIAAVVKPPSNPWVADFLERRRRQAGIETIPMPEARTQVPKALAEGKVVALVADQGAIRSTTWVPFFGRPTQTAEGPGRFAASTGAPVVFGTFVAEADGRYRGALEALEEEPRGDAAELVPRIATLYRQRLEAAVRLVPEQYLWTHRLWGRQPPAPPGAP